MAGPSGHLFSREAILESLLSQKKANKRKLKAWEAQQAEEANKVGQLQEAISSLPASHIELHGVAPQGNQSGLSANLSCFL